MMALQQAVDVLANNVANQRTTGYKATGIRFQECLSTEKPEDDG
ncbi:flagellar basal body protein, partial [Acinetobacter baumannii]